jgi:hypothetical protein
VLSSKQFEELLPLAVAWAEAQEVRILADGVALSAAQLSDARTIGVKRPERVRLLAVDAIVRPENSLLRAAAEATHLINPFTRGLTLRYGIYLRRDVASDRFLVAHELAHTAQYERVGGFFPFLRQYLDECLTIGYPAAPMEQEAIRKTELLRQQ